MEENKIKENELIRQEIALEGKALEDKKHELDLKKFQVKNLKLQLDFFEEKLEKGIMDLQSEGKIEMMQKMVDEKKDRDEKNITLGDVEEIKLRIKSEKRALDSDMPRKQLEFNIKQHKENLSLEENNLKVLETQVKEKKIITAYKKPAVQE